MPDDANSNAPKKKFPAKALGVVAGIAVLQGAGFFLFFKMSGGGPQAAHGEETHAVEPPEAVQQAVGVAEVQLLKSFKVPNDKSGRMWIYDIDLAVLVPDIEKEKVETLAQERAGEIGDTVARIVRSASDQVLREDDLRILRTQLAEGLAEITNNKKLIQRVLIPRLVPIPT